MEIVNEIIPVWGKPIDNHAVRQIQLCSRVGNCIGVALMADHHAGYSMPIGGVIAYRNQVSPSGIGYDIACGNKAVKLNIKSSIVRENIDSILDDIFSKISFGIGKTNSENLNHEIFNDPRWSEEPISRWKQMARDQLGTIGSGNHFIDIFIDEEDSVWVGVHFGSRGFGYKIASFFIKKGGGKDGMDVPPVVFDADSIIGKDYIEFMKLAGEYAYAGRDWVCEKVAKIMGAEIIEEIHNHHNYAWLEEHNNEKLWVIRKGATPAFPGQKSFIGGSMGDVSYIVYGVDSDESRLGFRSTVHGAGRVMGRIEAKGKIKKCKDPNSPDFGKTRIIREPKVKISEMKDWLKKNNVKLRGGDVDESPHCYKRLPEVISHQGNSIKIVHTLTPIGVVMADNDPNKD